VSFDDTCAAIKDIGRLTGNAAAVVEGMKARLASVQAKIGAIPDSGRPAVFWEVFDEPLMTAGKGTFVSELLALAGGKNIFGNLATPWPQVCEEEIIRAGPRLMEGVEAIARALYPKLF
jgi:iron complex transport system substrate-binding protein